MALTANQYAALKLTLRARLSVNRFALNPGLSEADLFSLWKQLGADAAAGTALGVAQDASVDREFRALMSAAPVIGQLADADWSSFFTTLSTDSSSAAALGATQYTALKLQFCAMLSAYSVAPGTLSEAGLLGYLKTRVSVISTPLTIFGAANVLKWCEGGRGTMDGSTWSDVSGNSFDNTGAFTVIATDATLNNLRTARFNGTSDAVTSGLQLPQSGTTPTCAITVVKLRAASASNSAVLSPGNGLANYCYFTPAGDYSSYNGTVVSTASGPAVNTWFRARNDFSNSAGDVVRAGSVSNTNNAGNVAAVAVGRGISADTTSRAGVDVWLELYLKVIPSGAQFTQLDAYISAATGAACAF